MKPEKINMILRQIELSPGETLIWWLELQISLGLCFFCVQVCVCLCIYAWMFVCIYIYIYISWGQSPCLHWTTASPVALQTHRYRGSVQLSRPSLIKSSLKSPHTRNCSSMDSSAAPPAPPPPLPPVPKEKASSPPWTGIKTRVPTRDDQRPASPMKSLFHTWVCLHLMLLATLWMGRGRKWRGGGGIPIDLLKPWGLT